MKLGLVQIHVSNDRDENLKEALASIKACAEAGAQLVILPELWNTPFDNPVIVQHARDHEVLIPALQKAAADSQVWLIGGSIPVMEKGRLYNRSLVFDDQGNLVAQADKNHLLEVHTRKHTYRESDVFTPGDKLCRFESPWGTIGLCICYDIRFPEVARLLCQDAFLMVVPAGFNARVGEKHWKPLLKTRAMENEVFTVGVNPAAMHYANYDAYGHSLVASPDGVVLAEMKPDEAWQVVEIDPDQVQSVRSRQPFWKLRRTDLYKLEESSEKN